jgi:ankyrin repeat protein
MDDNWFEREQLHFAAQDGDVNRLREVLARGHPVNAFDDIGMTPLHYAARGEHYEAAEFLIRSGADVNAHDESRIGNTPLGQVAGECSLRMAHLLVDAGADPTIPGWMQLTALHRAENRKQGDGPQVYELLLKAAESRWLRFCHFHCDLLAETGLPQAIVEGEDRFRDLLCNGSAVCRGVSSSLTELSGDQWAALVQFAAIFFHECEAYATLDRFPAFRREYERRRTIG